MYKLNGKFLKGIDLYKIIGEQIIESVESAKPVGNSSGYSVTYTYSTKQDETIQTNQIFGYMSSIIALETNLKKRISQRKTYQRNLKLCITN